MALAKSLVKTRHYVVLSAALHILLFVWVLGLSSNYQGNGVNEEYTEDGVKTALGNDRKIIDRPVEIEIITTLDEDEDGDQAKREEAKPDCEKWFGGVGVTIGPDGLIFEVHRGYPAERAGLQRGDIVFGYGYSRLIGEVGTPVEIEVYRPSTNQRMFYTIVREKICIDK